MSRAEHITKLITAALMPQVIEVVDESSDHTRGSETHFKALIVSERFAGLSRVKRQQLVYDLIRDEFDAGLHALTMTTATPEEWQMGGVKVSDSPTCMTSKNIQKKK